MASPIQTPFSSPSAFEGTIAASTHEHGGIAPQSIIGTDQSWAVNVSWTNTGPGTSMVGGTYDLHLLLERMGPGVDLDLTDPFIPDHIIRLTPGPSPVSYFRHVDIAANAVPAGVYKLVVLLRYFDLTGAPGPIAGYEETSPLLQFFDP